MALSALDSALTGPLFATEAMRAVFADGARLAAMLRVEAALARAQGEHGLAPAALAPAIEAIGAASLDAAAIGAATRGAGVPSIPFLKALGARLPADLEPHLHRGATTQDLMDSALALHLAEALALLADDLGATIDGLVALASRHRDLPVAGRTYGQQGAPTTFGLKAAGWALGLAEVAADLPGVRARSLTAQLGGPVGTLAGLGAKGPLVLERFAALLGLAADPAPWHARRDRVAALGAWLARLIGALAKLATDVERLGSTEVGEVAEPHAPGRGGSSAMPHKRNPVSCTVILAAHGVAPGLAATLLAALASAHERPAGAWHAEWHALPALLGLASGALREGRALAEGLRVFPDAMAANLALTRGLLFADAAAAALAPHLGAHAAHALVARAADGVREGAAGDLLAALRATPGVPPEALPALVAAFDPAPTLAAAGTWTDRALAAAARHRAALPAPDPA